MPHLAAFHLDHHCLLQYLFTHSQYSFEVPVHKGLDILCTTLLLNFSSIYTQIALISMYSKTCLKRPLKRTPEIGFQYRLLLNGGQKYCKMLQGEHSAILSTSIKLPFSIKTLVSSISKWLLKTGFTVLG